jgi:hypothetical protein
VSKKAALDDEDLSDSLAMLTRSTGSAKKGMEGMELAAEIARGRNVSLAVATKAVERAMLGSDTALKRLGISVPKVSVRYDALKEKIKGMQEKLKTAKGPLREQIQLQIDAAKAGLKRAAQLDKEEAAQSALTKAQRKFAGSAEAYGRTAAGAQEKLSVAFENLQERVGAKLLPVLTRLSLKLVELIDWSEANWPKFSAEVQKVYAKVKPVIDNMIERFKDISRVFLGVVRIIRGIANGEWSQVWGGMKTVVSAQLSLIYHMFLELPGKVIGALGRKAWSGLKAVGGYIGDAITAGLIVVLNRAIAMITSVINKVNAVAAAISKVVPGNLPKIPEISPVGSGGSKPKAQPGAGLRGSAPPGSRKDGDNRGLSNRSGNAVTIHNMTVQAKDANGLIRDLQRIANTQATPRRGRYGGANLGVG